MPLIVQYNWRHVRLSIFTLLLLSVCLLALFGGQDSAAAGALRDAGPVQETAPTIQIEPVSGSEGTVVTVNGSDFPGGTVIYVLLAGSVQAADGYSPSSPQVYATGWTDFNGNLWTQFAMPGTWPDGSTILSGPLTVVATTFGFTAQASATFDYVAAQAIPSNPTAEAAPSSGGPGTNVTIQGEGFTPRAQVYATIAKFDGQIQSSQLVVYATAYADERGRYRLSFSMPQFWPDGTPIENGPVLLLVQEYGSDRQASDVFGYISPPPTPTSTSTFTPTPTPTLTPTPRPTSTSTPRPTSTPSRNPWAQIGPDQGGPSTLVTISGGGFLPNRRVNAHIAGVASAMTQRSSPAIYASAMTDRAGAYTLQMLMPAFWPDGRPVRSGTLAILVATDDFEQNATVSFEYRTDQVAVNPWQGAYYDNETLSGAPVMQRSDSAIDFDWGYGSPDPSIPADRFSVAWNSIQPFQPGVYRFTAEVDDGIKAYVGTQLIIQEWRADSRRTIQAELSLPGGNQPLRVEYFERNGEAIAKLRWELVRPQAATPTPSPTPESGYKLLFDDDPRNNRRNVNNYFCSGFESECEFGTCPLNYRVVWALYCRGNDYPYIKAGEYRVTLFGNGNVRAGATDYGTYGEMYSFGEHDMRLPASYTFCWPGLQSGGTGFETVVQSKGTPSRINRMRIEYLGSCTP